MKKYLVCLASLFIGSNLFAQENFSLKDCIRYGLENHKTVSINRNEQAIAEAANKETRAGYLPSVSLNAGIDDNLKVQEQIIPAGVFGDEDVRVAFTKKFTASGSLQLDQKIYDQALIISLKTNKYRVQEAGLNAIKNEEEIIYNIVTAYYQIMVYRQQLDFLKDNDDIYNEQIRIAQLQVNKGVLAEVELYKIQVNSRNNLSQLRLCAKNISNSTNELKNAMGYPLNGDLEVISEAINDQTIEMYNPEFDVNNRTDYQLATIDATLQEMDYKKLQAGYLPTFSFYAKYGGNGFGDKLGESFRSINDFSSIGVKLSMPIFDGFTKRSQIQQSKLKYQNALETIKLNEAQFKMESENAKTKLTQAQTGITEDKESVDLAKSVLQITTLQYEKGIVDMTEWLNAQSSLKESQNNYLNSIVDWYVAQIDLEKANGTIKTFYENLH